MDNARAIGAEWQLSKIYFLAPAIRPETSTREDYCINTEAVDVLAVSLYECSHYKSGA